MQTIQGVKLLFLSLPHVMRTQALWNQFRVTYEKEPLKVRLNRKVYSQLIEIVALVVKDVSGEAQD